MSLDSDVIVDRRRIRRKLTFWRVVAALGVIAAVVAVGVLASPASRAITGSNAIARVKIDGLIRSDQTRVEALERLEKSSAAAVIVHINSPGRHDGGLRAAFRCADAPEGEEAAGRGGGRSRRVGRIHRSACVGPDHCPADIAGRFDRRAVSDSECVGSSQDRWRQGRRGEVVAAQGRAERL